MTDRQGWRRHSKCKSLSIKESDVLFSLGRGGSSKKAKAFCDGTDDLDPCPVKKECLAYALFYKERGGIWGGLTEAERDALDSFVVNMYLANASIDQSELRGPLDDWIAIAFPNRGDSDSDVSNG